jgi:hypothetical protein
VIFKLRLQTDIIAIVKLLFSLTIFKFKEHLLIFLLFVM